jgi:hypothetical protein
MTFLEFLHKYIADGKDDLRPGLLTQQEFGERLGFPEDTAQKDVSRIRKQARDPGSALEQHWRLFKKIATEVDQLSIFDEPLDADQTWHYYALKTHLDLPEERRNPVWRQLNEVAARIIKEEHPSNDDNVKTSKPRRPRKV